MIQKKAGKISTTLALMAGIALAPALSQANFSLGGPLSMLPSDVDFALGLKLDPAGDQNSFLHYVPRDEIAQYIREKWDEDGNEIPEMEHAGEAALLLTFHPDLLPKMRMIAIGGHNDETTQIPDLHFVMGGSFTAEDIDKVVTEVGGTAQTEEGPGTISSSEGVPIAHYHVPRAGILVVSKDQSWIAAAPGHLANRTGLASDTSNFRTALPTINNRDADLFFYAPTAPILKQAEPMLQSPEVAMFAMPLRQSRAITLGLYPTASSTAEVALTFTDETNAQTAAMMLNGLLEMAKAQMAMQLQMQLNDPEIANNPELKEQVEASLKSLQQTSIKAQGNAANLVIPIDRTTLGDPAESREKIMEFIRQQDEAGALMGGMQGGGFAPPPPGSGNPTW